VVEKTILSYYMKQQEGTKTKCLD